MAPCQALSNASRALPHVVGQVGQFANYIRHLCISPTARHFVASYPLACCGCAAILKLSTGTRNPSCQLYLTDYQGLVCLFAPRLFTYH